MLVLLLQLLLGTDCPWKRPDYTTLDRFYVALAPSPEFFVWQPCSEGVDPRVDVFATAGRSKKIGYLRWMSSGYCHAMFFEVGKRCPRGQIVNGEIGYEERAFQVVEERGRWVRIRLDQGTGWIHLSTKNAGDMVRYEELVTGTLAEMTEAWDGRIYAAPGERPRTMKRKREQSVTVKRWRRAGGKLWFEVELLSESPCTADTRRVVARGWVRGYSARRQPTVSHFSRGC